MRFLLSVLLIALLSGLLELILPWWSVALVSFAVSLIVAQRPSKAFLMGFAGVGLCWLVIALLHDQANDHILSVRMAQLFKLPNYGLFILVTVVVGGLVGGMSSWAGALIKRK
jgi:hypothetical protein